MEPGTVNIRIPLTKWKFILVESMARPDTYIFSFLFVCVLTPIYDLFTSLNPPIRLYPKLFLLILQLFPVLGDALFIHCNILHRSDDNNSDMRRWAYIACYNKRSNNPVKEHHWPCYTPLEKVIFSLTAVISFEMDGDFKTCQYHLKLE